MQIRRRFVRHLSVVDWEVDDTSWIEVWILLSAKCAPRIGDQAGSADPIVMAFVKMTVNPKGGTGSIDDIVQNGCEGRGEGVTPVGFRYRAQ